MEVEDECHKLLTINTHKGLYQFNRLPFCVASAPAIWQRTMEQVLQSIPHTQCMLDDILVAGGQDHLEHRGNGFAEVEQVRAKGKQT